VSSYIPGRYCSHCYRSRAENPTLAMVSRGFLLVWCADKPSCDASREAFKARHAEQLRAERFERETKQLQALRAR